MDIRGKGKCDMKHADVFLFLNEDIVWILSISHSLYVPKQPSSTHHGVRLVHDFPSTKIWATLHVRLISLHSKGLTS